MNTNASIYSVLIAALLIQIAGLVFAVYADPYVKRAHRIIMMMITGMVLLLIAQNYAGTRFSPLRRGVRRGLRAFKRVYMELSKGGGKLSARNVDKSIMEILEVTGFTRLFKFI